MLYNITYELKNNEKDYSSFFQTLKTLSPNTNQCMKNSWFVITSSSKQVLYEQLKALLESSDLLLISQVSLSQLSGWLPSDSVNWLQEHSNDI